MKDLAACAILYMSQDLHVLFHEWLVYEIHRCVDLTLCYAVIVFNTRVKLHAASLHALQSPREDRIL